MQVENQKITSQSSASVAEEGSQIVTKCTPANVSKSFIQYNGNITYCTDFIEFALICDGLLKKADAAEDIFVLGFDMEWYFNFKTGAGKAAVMQINSDLDTCFIIHLIAMQKLPKGISELLSHPKVRMTGVNVNEDVIKLSKDYPGFKVDKLIENCIDLGPLANLLLPFQRFWSMAKLVSIFLKTNINKDGSVRRSNWHVVPLTEKQITYAAIDSYVSLKLYLHMKELLEMKNKQEVNT